MHYIGICTKKGRKARRREGDKCFFRQIFSLAALFCWRLGIRKWWWIPLKELHQGRPYSVQDPRPGTAAYIAIVRALEAQGGCLVSLRYSLTEDEFYKRKQVRELMGLVTTLLDEVQRSNSMTPAMMASWLELTSESLSGVVGAAGHALCRNR